MSRHYGDGKRVYLLETRNSGDSVLPTARCTSTARATSRPWSPSSPGWTIDLAIGERSEGPILHRWCPPRSAQAHRWVRSGRHVL